jgi:hypothetical protein
MVAGDFSLRGVSGVVRLGSVSGDVSLKEVQRIAVETVDGDLSLRGARGPVEVGTVTGDLSLRETGPVAIDTVSGDLSVSTLKGALHVASVGGDASVRDVDGDVDLVSVSDDLAVNNVRGNVSADVGSDAVLYLQPRAGQTCKVTAGDDILLVLPPQAGATLSLSGDEIEVDWPGAASEEGATKRVITLGDGSASITLDAGGAVRLSNEAAAGERAEEFGNIAGVMFEWSDFGEHIARRVAQKAARAVRRTEQKVRGARFHGNVKVGRWNWDIKPGSFPPAAGRGEPVSEEERMAILKMLQEKKITSEEAEKLLAALEGGE